MIVFFFFLMIRRPPRSTRTDTLFPYTTLFRSVFDVTIACRNGSEITYDFTAFDTEQRAATLRRWDRELSDPAIRFQVRVDQQEAAEGYVTNPRYTNELMIGSDTPGITSSDMAKATKLVVRLLQNGGAETLEIDQTDSNERSVMEPWGIGEEKI